MNNWNRPTNSPIWGALLAEKIAQKLILKVGMIRLELLSIDYKICENQRDLHWKQKSNSTIAMWNQYSLKELNVGEL